MPTDDYNPRPLDYGRPDTPKPEAPALPTRLIPFGLARMIWLFTAALLGVLLVIVPLVEPTFTQPGLQTPAGTKLLFGVSRFLRNTYLWVVIAAVATVLPFLLARRGAGVGTRLAMIVLLLVGIGLTAWVVLSLFMPYVSMLQNLTEGVGK